MLAVYAKAMSDNIPAHVLKQLPEAFAAKTLLKIAERQPGAPGEVAA